MSHHRAMLRATSLQAAWMDLFRRQDMTSTPAQAIGHDGPPRDGALRVVHEEASRPLPAVDAMRVDQDFEEPDFG